MFTFLSRFRRQTAVLTALALVASVLVAVPVSAADDPEADRPATFSACVGAAAEDAGFTDVPDGHANAGDIDCIAYYGITKGTSATTYSPLMSVTREHMALFLTRLAGLVGIEVASDPSHSFTDVGDLSDESQTAIAQLADLGITQGTSDTTYSPADTVQRDHMALFISRLMNLMDPMEVDQNPYGYTPDDVAELENDVVGSPFTDLGSATKSAYDAITQLWELGVASGVSETSFNPSASITRAAMAGFMAGVLDHSNARPSGLSAQAVDGTSFGALDDTVVVSYRNDNFAPVEDMTIKFFHTGSKGTADTQSATIDDESGVCTPTDCNGDDDVTDTNGNMPIEVSVEAGNEIMQYAWVGDDDFDADDVTHVSVTVSAKTDAAGFAVESDINENADPGTVDVDVTDSVTFTVQLNDGAADNASDVLKPGQSIMVTFTRAVDSDESGSYEHSEIVNRSTATVKTDDSGQATFTVEAPNTDADENDDNVQDTVVFDGPGDTDVTMTVIWRDDDHGTANKSSITVPEYAVIYMDNANLVVDGNATVTLYDMYGNPAGTGLRVIVTIDGEAQGAERVNSRGQARFNRSKIDSNNNPAIVIDITDVRPKDGDTNQLGADPGVTDATDGSIPVVSTAADDTPAAGVAVSKLLKDENKFIGAVSGGSAVLYSYDSDDTYIDGSGGIIDMAKFVSELEKRDLGADTTADVDVVVYDDDRSSIFRLASS